MADVQMPMTEGSKVQARATDHRIFDPIAHLRHLGRAPGRQASFRLVAHVPASNGDPALQISSPRLKPRRSPRHRFFALLPETRASLLIFRSARLDDAARLLPHPE